MTSISSLNGPTQLLLLRSKPKVNQGLGCWMVVQNNDKRLIETSFRDQVGSSFKSSGAGNWKGLILFLLKVGTPKSVITKNISKSLPKNRSKTFDSTFCLNYTPSQGVVNNKRHINDVSFGEWASDSYAENHHYSQECTPTILHPIMVSGQSLFMHTESISIEIHGLWDLDSFLEISPTRNGLSKSLKATDTSQIYWFAG